jgi:hypothetical protein
VSRLARWTGFLWRRVLATALLAVVVASQPWWWNVGEVRPHAVTPAAAPQ